MADAGGGAKVGPDRRLTIGSRRHQANPPARVEDAVEELFLTGRHRAPVEVVANEIVSAGGSAEAAEVDALDEQAVDTHLQSVIDKTGRVDISFNAIGIPSQKIRVPLVELDVEQFSLPIATYTRSYFLTA
ncbi:MAG: SDR family oxidoreductase, partial [Chloroflexi bacterium]